MRPRHRVAHRFLLTAWLIGISIPIASVAAKPNAAVETPEQQSALCVSAVRTAEARYGTPPGLLDSIAKAESGRQIGSSGIPQAWPWAVNIAGVGQYFATKEAAVTAVRQALARGTGYIDVGCMQVDLQFHPTAFRTLEEAFDPVINADYAARFLVSLREAANGNWYVAVGLYHSRSPELARLYRERVTMAGTGIGPRTGSARPGKLRIALPDGRVVVINVNRQPSRAPRQRTACQVATILGSYLAARTRTQACAAPPASGPGVSGPG